MPKKSQDLHAIRAKRQEQAQRMHLSALATLTTLRRLLPAKKAGVTGVVDNPTSKLRRNGHHNGHLTGLLPGISNRLVNVFDDLFGTNEEAKQEQDLFAIGADN